jgi:hypothetical protein
MKTQEFEKAKAKFEELDFIKEKRNARKKILKYFGTACLWFLVWFASMLLTFLDSEERFLAILEISTILFYLFVTLLLCCMVWYVSNYHIKQKR